MPVNVWHATWEVGEPRRLQISRRGIRQCQGVYLGEGVWIGNDVDERIASQLPYALSSQSRSGSMGASSYFRRPMWA
jgi:hypothetical protein